MVQATGSGCINHPAIEAIARCKQCMTPVCGECAVGGPAGNYCSAECKEKHETFLRRAHDNEQRRGRTRDKGKVFRLLTKIVIFVVAAGGLLFAAAYFDIPVAGDIARKILGNFMTM